MDARFSGLGLVVSNAPLPPRETLLHSSAFSSVAVLIGAVSLLFVATLRRRMNPRLYSRENRMPRVSSTLLFISSAMMAPGCHEARRVDGGHDNPQAGTPLVAQLGKVMQGDLIKHTFLIKNPTSDVVVYERLVTQ
jgi:hypothetical protein